MANWFFIRTAASGGDCYGLNVANWSTAPGSAVITWAWQGGAANELWSMPGDGQIASAIGAGIYLSIGPDGSSLVVSDQPTSWTFLDGGQIAGPDGRVIGSASPGSLEGGAVGLVAAASDPIPSTQRWWTARSIIAVPTTPSWVKIAGSAEGGSKGLVVDVSGAPTAVPVQLCLADDINASTQYWQFAPEGLIINRCGSGLVMGVSSADSNVWLQSADLPTPGNQTWIRTEGGAIALQSGSLALTSNVNTLSVTPPSTPPTADQLFDLVPSHPLDRILAGPPIPYPDFLDRQDGPAAYAAIQSALAQNNKLDADLRATYTDTNYNGSFSEFWTTVHGMQCPSGVTAETWSFVQGQILAELTYVPQVQTLFMSYNDYNTQTFVTQNSTVTQLISDCQLTDSSGSGVGGLILSLLSGIVYTALSAAPGVGGLLANVIQTGINVAVSAANMQSAMGPDPFQVAVSDLWRQLNQNFEALSDATGTTALIILTDWGKLAVTGPLAGAGGPLDWTNDSTPALVQVFAAPFAVGVMQMLLPAKYQVFYYPDDNGDPVSGVPDDAQWVTQNPAGGDKPWVKYWIAEQEDWKTYPTALANDVWGNGASKQEFFQSVRGWAFPTALWFGYSQQVDKGCLTISNQSPYPLTVSIAMTHGGFDSWQFPSSDGTLAAYGQCSCMFHSNFLRGIEAVVSISNGSSTVASFTYHMGSGSGVHAGDVSIDTTSTNGPFRLSAPVCNNGSVGDGYAGAAQITVSAVPVG